MSTALVRFGRLVARIGPEREWSVEVEADDATDFDALEAEHLEATLNLEHGPDSGPGGWHPDPVQEVADAAAEALDGEVVRRWPNRAEDDEDEGRIYGRAET